MSVSKMKLYCSTGFGLEAVVKRELIDLQCPIIEVRDGAVITEGDWHTIALLNVHLRCSERVWWLVDEFQATTFDMLYDAVKAIPWSDLVQIDSNIPVSGKSIKSVLSSVPNCQKITKKAIVDALLLDPNVSSLPETGARFPVSVHLLRDVASILIDTSGVGLHKRGYRLDQGDAPLKETLAAALIYLSYFGDDRILYDPFCGSGTIAIEAAMMSKHQAPGLYRDFVSTNWPQMKGQYEVVKQEAAAKIRTKPVHIYASDDDANVIAVAIRNATRARVFDVIRFQNKDARTLVFEGEFPVIITNPPYGERLQDQASMRQLMKEWLPTVQAAKSPSLYVLTSEPQLERLWDKPASKRRVLFNGPIKTTFYQWYGPKPKEKT
jgi:putative N6-adenine-specific DNA methylase